ncbi:hypothetical protein BDW74DRAFT_164158 [Aspergillus multicolor]|uniref:IQ calmodulin-binding motif protein n=1 Tax=Aspergillus multicolor TaxID=41759 RepID=UPI003CCDF89A
MTDPESDRGDADPEDDVTVSQFAAACLIQRVYRGYRTRRELEGRHLTATNRWIDGGSVPGPPSFCDISR